MEYVEGRLKVQISSCVRYEMYDFREEGMPRFERNK